MGCISGAVGWLVWWVPTIVGRTSPVAVTPWRWFMFVAIPSVVSALLAMLFPVWHSRVRIHSLPLQCIAFWVVVPFVLVLGYVLVVFGISVVFVMKPTAHLLTFFLGLLATGGSFYWIGKILKYSPGDGRRTL